MPSVDALKRIFHVKRKSSCQLIAACQFRYAKIIDNSLTHAFNELGCNYVEETTANLFASVDKNVQENSFLRLLKKNKKREKI